MAKVPTKIELAVNEMYLFQSHFHSLFRFGSVSRSNPAEKVIPAGSPFGRAARPTTVIHVFWCAGQRIRVVLVDWAFLGSKQRAAAGHNGRQVEAAARTAEEERVDMRAQTQ